jgi:hypothetical protein
MPIYLVPVIKECSFLEGFEPNTQNLTPKGRPFYIASGYRTSASLPIRTSDWRFNSFLRHGGAIVVVALSGVDGKPLAFDLKFYPMII